MSDLTIDTTRIETNKFNEVYLTDVNGSIFDSVPSEVLFKKYFSDLKDNYLRIIVGTDSGLLVRYIDDVNADKNTVHLFIEHQEIIDYINKNISYDSSKIHLLAFNEDIETYIKKNAPVFYITGELFLSKSLCVIDKKADYEPRFEQVLDSFNNFVAKRNYEIPNTIFTNTNIQDQIFLDNSLAVLEQKIENIPALVLGGGPTLDESIDWIKEHQNKFLIIAVGRVAHRLIEEGINPDAIATIDPTELSFSNSKEMLNFSKHSLLVSSNHPNFKLAGQWEGKSVYIGKRLGLPSAKNPPYIDIRGNTVSNFAAQFAMVVGCRQVFLSGVDFCHLASGQSHEGKSLESQIGVSSDISSQIKNYAGETVGTRPNFKIARSSLDYMVRDFKLFYQDLEVYALSDKTAAMKYIAHKKINDIDLNHYSEDNKKHIQDAFNTYLINDPQTLIEDLEHRKAELKQVQKLLLKAQKHIDKKISALNPEWTDLSYINDFLQKIVQKTEAILSPELLEFIKNYGYQTLIASIRSGKRDIKGADSQLQLDRISFLNLINETIETLSLEIQQAEQLVNKRIAETKQTSDPVGLMEFWLEQELPGRIHLWQEQYTKLFEKLQQKNPELIETAIQNYKDQFDKSQNVKQNLEKKSRNVNYYLDQMNEYRKDKKIDLLLGLKEQLEKNKNDSTTYHELQALIGANIALLKQNLDQALDYIAEIKSKNIIQFNALQLKLNIAMTLQHHEATLETLLLLCEYSSSYMPKYAEFLRIVGNETAAIEIYRMYLSIKPEDTESIIKLYYLLENNGQTEAAQQLIQQKHEEMPEDPMLNKLIG